MKADITRLPIGTWFKYQDEEYKVVNRDEYPFIECERRKVLFTNFEQVEISEKTQLLDYPKFKIYRIKRQ